MRRLTGKEKPLRHRRGKLRPRPGVSRQRVRIGAERPGIARPAGLGDRRRAAAEGGTDERA